MLSALISLLSLGALLSGTDAYVTTNALHLQMRNYTYTFEEYMMEYGKSYESEDEYEMRRALFEERLAMIREHNEDPVRSKYWRQGLNSHTDRTADELKRLRGYDRGMGHRARASSGMRAGGIHSPAPVPDVERLASFPDALDWREKPGVLTAIKDQGNCGSCWAFAATETIESHWFLSTGRQMDLSVQDIVSCAPNPKQCGGTGGCNGATPQVAYDHVIAQGGLQSDSEMPYLQSFNNTTYDCPSNPPQTLYARVTSYVNVATNSLDGVLAALQVGPVATAIDASGLQSYESGIYDACDPSDTTLDHAVVIVGYGSEKHADGTVVPYWILRNSWGTGFGENGYFRFKRELDTPKCGTDNKPMDGSACVGDPTGPIQVCGTCGILYDVTYPNVSKTMRIGGKRNAQFE